MQMHCNTYMLNVMCKTCARCMITTKLESCNLMHTGTAKHLINKPQLFDLVAAGSFHPQHSREAESADGTSAVRDSAESASPVQDSSEHMSVIQEAEAASVQQLPQRGRQQRRGKHGCTDSSADQHASSAQHTGDQPRHSGFKGKPDINAEQVPALQYHRAVNLLLCGYGRLGGEGACLPACLSVYPPVCKSWQCHHILCCACTGLAKLGTVSKKWTDHAGRSHAPLFSCRRLQPAVLAHLMWSALPHFT